MARRRRATPPGFTKTPPFLPWAFRSRTKTVTVSSPLSTRAGVFGEGTYGVQAIGTDLGVFAHGRTVGVQAHGTTVGVQGDGEIGTAGFGTDPPGDTGRPGLGSVGVLGIYTGDKGLGVLGWSRSDNGVGVWGIGGKYGVVVGTTEITNGIGVSGTADNGENAIGVYGSSQQGWAGFFDGWVYVKSVLQKAGGGFKIDHPLDPGNKYLVHSFVESPDMKNVYDGTVTTDATGEAVVVLPDYFEAVNRDFRYQLTVVGQFAQAIVSSEVQQNRFSIKTDKPGVKVCWQVTGIRKDPFAEKNRLVPEEPKRAEHQSKYLHPELYGQPATAGIGYLPPTQPPRAQPPSVREPLERPPVPHKPPDTSG
jgi:hypothetical protein